MQLERRPSSSQATSGVAGGGTLAADAAAQFDAGAVAKTGDPVRDKCRLNFGVALQVGEGWGLNREPLWCSLGGCGVSRSD